MAGKEKSKISETKREQLLGRKKSFPSWKVIGIIVVASGLSVGWLLFKGAPQTESSQPVAPQVMEKVAYTQPVNMVKADAVVNNGNLELPLDEVKKDKLVAFEYQGKEGKIPLLAYITPSGKLVTAVSVCEPCNSTRFHIEGNHMVCNACFTRWELETLKGVSGGCLKYPPDALPCTVQGGKISIKEVDLKNWKPRVSRG